MLDAVGHPFWVGRTVPDAVEPVFHDPDGGIHHIARLIVSITGP
jgi:hypothetical protein